MTEEKKKPVRKASALKAARAASRRAVYNVRWKKAMKDAVKRMSKLVAAKDAAGAGAHLASFQKALDKAAKGGVIKKNAAARLKSRAAKHVRALA